MEQPVITRRQLKVYASLDTPKGRRESGFFVAEGTKCVSDLADAFRCATLYATAEWLSGHTVAAEEIVEVAPQVLRSITRLPSAPPVVAFFRIPASAEAETPHEGELAVALDRVQDPGNLGTIVRCCSWMGVRRIVASPDTVDCFNPKAVQASMGALARVQVTYTDLAAWLAGCRCAVYGTFLDGENIYTADLGDGAGVLVMGNEGSGISAAVEKNVNRRIFIPPYPIDSHPQDSLNVGMATAVALSQFRQRLIK